MSQINNEPYAESLPAIDEKPGNNSKVSDKELPPLTLPLDKIVPDPEQTRKEFPESELVELANSINRNGLITPILVVRMNEAEEKYKIVDGERRYRAFRELQKNAINQQKYDSITVSILQNDQPINGILANMARKIYNPMESAEALQFIKQHDNLTDEQVGRLVEKSRSSVTEYLNLLNLPDEIKEAAKQDSCVPFRALKKLIALGNSNEDKVQEYLKLVKKYKEKGKRGPRKEGAKTAWSPDRRAKGLQKKVEAFSSSFDKYDIADIQDQQQKLELKNSLERMAEKVNSILRMLDDTSA